MASDPGVTLVDALRLGSGRQMLLNKLADEIGIGPEHQILYHAEPFRTGTFFACNRTPGKSLGTEMVSGDTVFQVPENYQKRAEAGYGLFSEQPASFYMEHGKYYINVEITDAHKLPSDYEYHKTDSMGIPTDEKSNFADTTARQIILNRGQSFGLLVRNFRYDLERTIFAQSSPDTPFGACFR